MTQARSAPTAWIGPALLGAAIAGLGITIYLTGVHYQGLPLACTRSSVVDCSAVQNSSYSLIPGTSVPITLLGIGWFAVSATLAVGATRSSVRGQRVVLALHVAWGASGLVYVLYLVYIELVVIHRLCEWCTAVHALVFVTFVLALRRLQLALLGEGI